MHPKIQFVHGEICPDPFISETNGLRPVFQKLQVNGNRQRIILSVLPALNRPQIVQARIGGGTINPTAPALKGS
jgi:hypothetical protein